MGFKSNYLSKQTRRLKKGWRKACGSQFESDERRRLFCGARRKRPAKGFLFRAEPLPTLCRERCGNDFGNDNRKESEDVPTERGTPPETCPLGSLLLWATSSNSGDLCVKGHLQSKWVTKKSLKWLANSAMPSLLRCNPSKDKKR